MLRCSLDKLNIPILIGSLLKVLTLTISKRQFVEISTEKDALKNKIGDYDEKWLQDSKDKLLKQIDVEKRANIIMSKMEKQMEKH